MVVSRLLVVAGVCLWAVRGFGLTWEEARQAALVGNSDVRAGAVSLDKAKYQRRGQVAAFLPRVGLTASRTIAREESDLPQVEDQTTSDSVGLQVSQNLFAGGRDWARYVAETANVTAAEAGREKVLVETRAALRKAFDEALGAEELARLNRVVAERRENNVRITSLRYEGGREHKGSVLKTEAYAMGAKVELQDADANLRVARLKLGELIGRPLSESEKIEGTLPDRVASDTGRVEKVSEPAEIREARGLVASAEASVTASRAAYFGEISLDAGASRSGEDLSEDTTRWTVSLSASLPILQAQTPSSVRVAALEKSRAELALEAKMVAWKTREEQVRRAFESALGSLEVSRKMLDASRLLAEVTRQRYTLGLVSFADWDLAETELISAERKVISARVDLARALADRDALRGVSLEEGAM
jgi:outer membrane protein TolC